MAGAAGTPPVDEILKDQAKGIALDEHGFEWTPELDIILFQALVKFRPVGVHKHFRMLSVRRYFNKETALDLGVKQLRERLEYYYDMDTLNALVEEAAEDPTADPRPEHSNFPFKTVAEFSLPTESFDHSSSAMQEGSRHSTPGVEGTPEPSYSDDQPPATAPVKRSVGRPRKHPKPEPAPPASEPPSRRTRAASTSVGTPTPAAKRTRRRA
ncbi:hypothetical protein HDU85_005004 [Gaertneriomyces sp. JEL0708]|nr:hypothetical protein HDU85_005004 [Gaertneriomyces sp. JEL0708]